MPCSKCGHDDVVHRYLEESPFLKRPCLFKDCGCADYNPDKNEIEEKSRHFLLKDWSKC